MFENQNGVGYTMNVAPMPYGGYGYGGGAGGLGCFGGDSGIWLIVLLMLCGWGGNGGWGGNNSNNLYPWFNNSNQINDGFRDQMINGNITGIQNAVTSGFGDVQTALCGGFAGVNATINGAQNAISQQMYTGEIANLNRSFAEQAANQQGFNAVQGQLAQCCCDNRLATCQTQNLVQSEAAATRLAGQQGNQMIMDKLCQLEIDGLKRDYENQISAKDDIIAQLRSEALYSRGQASQVAQTAELRSAGANIARETINELRSCPIPAQAVYGNQPVFTCSPSQNGFGCGNAFAAA